MKGPQQFKKLHGTVARWADALRYATTMAYAPRPRPCPANRPRSVVVLARDLPPAFHGGSLRILALLRTLMAAGWDTHVVTNTPDRSSSRAGLALLPHLPAGLPIHYWTKPTMVASWRYSPRLSGDFTSIAGILDTAGALHPAPSMVIASGPPFAEFVAAAVLASRLRVPYVLDYRDEWTTSALQFVTRGPGDRLWERRTLAGASAVVFTTDGMRRHYGKSFPKVARSVSLVTIHNGWDASSGFAPTPPALPALARPLNITFIGWLGEHWDFPEFTSTLSAALTRTAMRADQLRISLYGTVSAQNRAVLESFAHPGVFSLEGLVPHHRAQAAMMDTNALLLLNSARLERVLPGKIFEYIAARRPILLYGMGGEMESLLRQIPGALIVPRGKPKELGAAIQQLRNGAPAAAIASAPDDYALAFHRQGRDREWVALLDSLTGTAR